ncbi:MAG: ATP-binding protein [Myxococcota bacterium]|nr:ATP-binding protein [Myxococcota bacterium]
MALRSRAEEIAAAQASIHPEAEGELSPQLAKRLLRELRVHQIELELQNEGLRRSEHAHERARARYADLFDRAPIGYVCVDSDGRMRAVNATAQDRLGLPSHALIGRPFTRLVAAEDQDAWYLCRRRLLRDRSPQRCELRLVDAERETFWARLDVVEPPGSEHLRIAVTDVDEQRKYRAALERSEERFRALYQHSSDALLILRPPEWRVREGNAAALALFGAGRAEELASLTLWDHDAAPTRAHRSDPTAPSLHEGAWLYAWTLQRLDGTPFHASVAVSPVEIGGEPALLMAVRDQTTLDAERATLAQEDRIASMGMLAASVAHEINNPLTYLLMLIESLDDALPRVAEAARAALYELGRALGEEGARERLGADHAQLEAAPLKELCEQARACRDATQRIRNISLALGTFARVDDEAPAAVDLSNAIGSAVEMSCNEVRHRARLIQSLESTPTVLGSEGQLSQVFLNLLINAARSIEPGAVQDHLIRIRTWYEDDRVFAEVCDDGAGISQAHLTRAFEPFFSTRPRGSGTGLGLTICRDIVESHGGSIDIESEVGEGTRVQIALPAYGEPPAKKRARSAQRSSRAARGKVLVVDDEAAILKIVGRLLGELHAVVTAGSGAEAQRVLEQDGGFDVILCDVMMPIVGGTDLHAWLRERDEGLAQRMLFMTGGVLGSEVGQYIHRHQLRVLQKPFDRQTLVDAVSQRVREARADRSAV